LILKFTFTFTVTTDEDVDNMIDEYDCVSLNENPRAARLRLKLIQFQNLTNPKSQINTISKQPKKKNTQNIIGRMKKEVAAEQEEGRSSSSKTK
jgi:hypothetical protein